MSVQFKEEGMASSCIVFLVVIVALATSMAFFPVVLRYAKKHKIVDNPNARKLQRVPIPVMGGVVVYAGILAGGLVMNLFIHSNVILIGLVGMTLMMIIGVWDDIRDISAVFRFLFEIGLVGTFILITGTCIDNFHGLWGIYDIPLYIAYPLSIFTGVGVINAVNLIDGVDGYSSGYGMLACGLFCIVFALSDCISMVCLTLIGIAALFPFFMHNVFGQRSKMFIGDGGTLMLGMLMVTFGFTFLSSKQPSSRLEEDGVSLLAFSLAVLCIPIFDTLRVMSMRMCRGISPFHPDKTHLHHLFIDMGFSHLGAALFILLINFLVVMAWFVSWSLGASIELQTYIVIALGFLVTFCFYKLMKSQQFGGPVDEEGYPLGTPLWHFMCHLGTFTHREDRRSWRVMRKLMDTPILPRRILRGGKTL